MKSISKESAIAIVNEVNAILEYKINVMDTNGIIIASSDKKRINTFHGGAKKIIDEKLDSVIIYYDGEYEGAKKGLNLPIIVDNNYVGVVGITGEYNEVEKYGRIIKKITEVLMLEEYLKEKKTYYDQIKNMYISEWLNDNKEIDEEFVKRGNTLGINIKIPRFIIITRPDIDLKDNYDKMQLFENIYDYLKTKLESLNNNNIIYKEGQNIIVLLNEEENKLLNFFKKIKIEIESKYKCRFYIGIGGSTLTKNLKINKNLATNALDKALRGIGNDIVFHTDINFESLINDVSILNQKNFLYNIFKNYKKEEIKDALEIIKKYYTQNGSLKKTSKILNMHINTLQYQLKKIKEKTNYDPRLLKDSIIFNTCIVIFNNLY